MTIGPGRLRGDQFEYAPKRVIQADLFEDRIDALADEAVAKRYNELVDCITYGRIVPRHFYRRTTRVDDLLVQYGIKHLHLDGGGGNVILFAVEYHDAVVLLEINGHGHLEADPPGSVLRSLHANCLRAQDADATTRAAIKAADDAKLRENLKARLKPRRSSGVVLDGFFPRGKGR